VTIQGLSGTGKTELLLHKLKDIYLGDDESKIMLTCHNKILAEKLRKRIPSFFNFMKVEQQIKWSERLWCVHAWGSMYDKDSGAYRNICEHYGLEFHRFSRAMSFDRACSLAVGQLSGGEKIQESGFAYDYILLDESQDFPDSFIDLCEMVTKKTVYVAGDIFQSIFDENIVSSVSPNFLMSKCYRTDPRTLMFSHALGMGLFEQPPLRWLNDDEWEKCGYMVNHNELRGTCTLEREPLRRFDDLEGELTESFSLINTDGEGGEEHVLRCIGQIQTDNPGVTADDIGIIIIGHNQDVYKLADRLGFSVPRHFDWPVNKAYETKATLPGHLFVSNKNNVKGLEFPFVICVSDKIRRGLNYRNALYMMLTRSFIKTYFLVPRSTNEVIFDLFVAGLKQINEQGIMEVRVPSQVEQDKIRTRIQHIGKNQSYNEFIDSIFEELKIPLMWHKSLYDSTKSIIGDNFDRDNALEIVSFNFNKMDS
jgi:superfamily I DNA and RNA helicase